MAQIDHSIYSQLKGVDAGASLEQGMRLADLGQQRKAKQLEVEKQAKIQGAYQSSMNPDGSMDQKKLLSQIGQVDGEKALTLGRDFKKDGDQDLERKMRQVEIQGQLLGSATDDTTWMQAKQKAQSMGVDVSQLPDHFNPGLKQMLVSQTLKAKDQLDLQWREQEAQRSQQNANREFERAGDQFQKTFGLQSNQFDYTKKQGDRNFGLEEQKFGYTQQKDQQEFGLKEREVKAKERESLNGKQLPSDKVLLVNEGNSIPTMLTSIKKTIKNNNGSFGPIVGRIGSANPYDTKSQTIDSQVRAASQAFGRYMEGGVLRKEDEDKYRKMFPNLSDTPDVAANKLAIVEKLLVDKQTSNVAALKNSGYDTSGVTQKLEGGQLPAILGGQQATAKNLEALPDDQLDALFNQLQGQ